MPYLKEERKEQLDNGDVMQNGGELNYMITSLIKDYLDTHEHKYETLNTIVGSVEAAKQEFIRRIVNPYEDIKIIQNGDVYTCVSK